MSNLYETVADKLSLNKVLIFSSRLHVHHDWNLYSTYSMKYFYLYTLILQGYLL